MASSTLVKFTFHPVYITGGYVVSFTDPSGDEHCDSVDETSKLESECSRGEGATFQRMAAFCADPLVEAFTLTHR